MTQIPVYAGNVKANGLFVFYKDLIKASSSNNIITLCLKNEGSASTEVC